MVSKIGSWYSLAMPRFLIILIVATLFSACARHPALTPVSAANLAASLANERCASQFGERPFIGEDFDATWENGVWKWGSDNGNKVDGYEVEVTFASNGKHKHVVVRGRDFEGSDN